MGCLERSENGHLSLGVRDADLGHLGRVPNGEMRRAVRSSAPASGRVPRYTATPTRAIKQRDSARFHGVSGFGSIGASSAAEPIPNEDQGNGVPTVAIVHESRPRMRLSSNGLYAMVRDRRLI